MERELIFDLIECTPGVVGGAPRLKGTRINVNDVITGVNAESDVQEYVEDFELEKEAVLQAINYCANQQCNKDQPKNYCDGCILRSIAEELDVTVIKNSVVEEYDSFIKLDNGSIFLGTKEDYLLDMIGVETWLIAKDLRDRYADLF